MSALNLIIDERKVSYDIKNNVIILKKNNNIVFELPIPNGYHLISTKSYECDERYETYFIITPYKLLPPTFIPEGYGNPEINISGMWVVSELYKSQHTWPIRQFIYMDTSLLKPLDFIEPFENNFKICSEDIPKSFWFSNQYREFIGRFDIKSSWERIKPRDIQKYIQLFEPRSRLISEYECMSIIAYNNWRTLEKVNTDLYPDAFYQENGEFMLVANDICIENWDKVVASNENPNVYRLIIEKEHNINSCLRNRAFTCSDDKLAANFIIPVIDEESEKGMSLQYIDKN